MLDFQTPSLNSLLDLNNLLGSFLHYLWTSNGYDKSGQDRSKTDKTGHRNEKSSRNRSQRRIHLKSNSVNPLTLKNPKTITPLVQNNHTDEDELLKSKGVDCTKCQSFQVQVEELKCVKDSLTKTNQKLLNSRERGKVNLQQRDEKISALRKKLRLLEEQSEVFHKISDQEMKQQIILFEEDKRMFLAKNEFLEKVSSSVQKEYNDLLASNDILRQSLETKFNLLQHDKSIEQMIETIEKEMGDTVKRCDAEKKVFENKISNMEKVLEQRVKDFDEVKTELSKRTDKFETYFANLEKENALLKSKLASQNYTSLQKENNDLRTSYNELKEIYETSCEKLEKENNDLKMHYKRLFGSINQKYVVSQVFTNSSPKVNVSEKIFTGKSSKPISKKISQFTTYSLQKDMKYLKNNIHLKHLFLKIK
nr:outer membrane protein porin [Tanacetum cinerariifolium]